MMPPAGAAVFVVVVGAAAAVTTEGGLAVDVDAIFDVATGDCCGRSLWLRREKVNLGTLVSIAAVRNKTISKNESSGNF